MAGRKQEQYWTVLNSVAGYVVIALFIAVSCVYFQVKQDMPVASFVLFNLIIACIWAPIATYFLTKFSMRVIKTRALVSMFLSLYQVSADERK